MARPALVTNAPPYANGPLHLATWSATSRPTWVGRDRMRGDTVHFVCADDTHGTPIMLAAEKGWADAGSLHRRHPGWHERDFAAFGVAF